jgi:voltage-gated sodium channel
VTTQPPGVRAKLERFLDTPLVQRSIIALIVMNAVVLGLETVPSVMSQHGALLYQIDHAMLVVFVVELSLRLFAMGPVRFFKEPWNVFDFIVVAIALVPASGPFAVLRALRVLRVMRLVSAIPSMRKVVEALIRSLPGMGSIAALLCIVLYVFAVMATKLFGADHPQWFGSLGGSLFTLFQIMTMEGWADIAREVMVAQPLAWLFFLSFLLLGTFTVLNLFIAVIVNAMQEESVAKPDPEVLVELRALRSEIAALRSGSRQP